MRIRGLNWPCSNGGGFRRGARWGAWIRCALGRRREVEQHLPERLALGIGPERGRAAAPRRAAPLILIGDAFHNFVDGVVIAAALLMSVLLGTAADFGVIAHEILQEVGDFATLLMADTCAGRRWYATASPRRPPCPARWQAISGSVRRAR